MGYFKPYLDSMSYYDGKCATCLNYNLYNISAAYKDGFKCVVHSSRRLALDDSCRSYREDRRRTYKDIEKAFKELEKKYGRYAPHSYSVWYIMTVVCQILGIEEYQKYLALGVYFREEYLEKDILKNCKILVNYDMNGRLIADSINQDEQKEVVAQELFNTYLLPFCNAIEGGQNDVALGIYLEMFEKLKDIYKVEVTYDFSKTYQTTEEDILYLRRTKNNVDSE